MAEVNVTTLTAVAPVVQRNAANQGSSAQAGQNEQSSFAQVLKSRSQAQNTPKPPSGKDSAKPSDTAKASDKTVPDASSKDSVEKTDQTTNAADQTVQTPGQSVLDPALLLAAAAANAGNSKSGKGTQDQENNADDLPSDANRDLQSSLPSLAASAAALAEQAAKLAGQSASTDQATNAAQASANRQSAITSSTADARQSSDAASAKTDVGKTLDTTTISAGKPAEEKSASFATELANASQNLAPGASPQTTHGILSTVQTSSNNTALPQHAISTPVTSQAWADEVGQKVSWIANRDNGRAELILTPPHMGRVEVSISMSGDQATASFIAASPAAREALQDAMPRLREVLAQSGIQLGQANVNSGFNGQTPSDNPGNHSTASRFAAQNRSDLGNIDSLAGSSRSNWSRQGNGMIDTFA